jgi:putative membrane protein
MSELTASEPRVDTEVKSFQKSLLKGLLAGAIAGLVATAAKSAAEKLYPPRTHGEPEPPELLAEKLAGHPLDEETEAIASEAIHWGFGALAGAAYGALVEFHPIVAGKEGANFGLALMSLTHEGALPAMGLSAPPEEQTFREHTSEAGTHVIYGVVTEKVRKFIRGLLD